MDSYDIALSHFGVKGMHWGVRKAQDPASAPDLKLEGVTIGRDGSISIEKGAQLQRLVRSNGESLPMKDLTYASINAYDNAKYVKAIGGKGLLGGGRDTILTITATQPIKAPSVAESTKLISDLMIRDSAFRKNNTDALGREINDKDLAKIKADPTGKTARDWYWNTNQKLTFSKDYDPQAPFVQKKFRETFEAKGFNAVRDENDVTSKIAKAPIIIFAPEKSLKVVGVQEITDSVRKANNEQRKLYKKLGKEWLDEQLYGR